MDYNEFASKIKTKYPDYADMDNRELAQKMVAKFPQYSDVTFDEPQQPSMLDQAAEISSGVQNAVMGPIVSGIASGAKAISRYATGSEKPAEILGQAVNYLPQKIEQAGEYVAEKGAQGMTRIGIPQNVAIPVAATAGMVTANAPYMIPFEGGPAINTALEPFKGKPGVAARIKQMRTGVEASAFEQLRRDPMAFFQTTAREDAGRAIGKAKQEAGISVGVTDDISTLTPENISKARNLQSSANKAQDDVISKIEKGLPVGPGEVSTALDGINKRLNRLERSEGRGSPSFQQWSAIKSHFQNLLEQVAPEVKEANRKFSRIALRDKFMEPMPVNQSGTMSKISAFGFTPAGAGVGAVAGGPVGALLGAASVQAVRSPFIAGLGTATRGIIDKIVDPALTRSSNALAQRPLLLEYLSRKNDRKTNGQ